jgi:leader peptidase (prepilin peptidase) / N-methyltransferase
VSVSPLVVTLLVTLACALVAILATGHVRSELSRPSRWVGAHVPLAAAGAVGAALVADNLAELLAYAAGGTVVALLMVIDLAAHRLPDRFVAAAWQALVLPLTVVAATHSNWEALGRALLASLLSLVGYFVLAYLAPWGIGLGDVKFAAVTGAFLGWFGWPHVLWGVLLAFAVNFFVLLAVVVLRRKGRRADVPFGPAMVAGAVLAVALLGA